MNLKPKNILLCDDHELILSGLKQVIAKQFPNTKIVTASTGKEGIDRLKESSFDLVISDVSMPEVDGIELSAYIKKEIPACKVIMLTQFSDIQVIKPLLKNGVDGILLKGGKSSEIIEAIEVTLKGEKRYSSTILHVITSCFAGKSQNESALIIKLSKRELQVLKLIAEEQTNKGISETLFISIPTVETYRRNLFRKFDVKNSVGLIRKAMQLGFVS